MQKRNRRFSNFSSNNPDAQFDPKTGNLLINANVALNQGLVTGGVQVEQIYEREDGIKTVYDPEIPVNIYDLGLIYRIDLPGDAVCNIDMTLTAPNCPAADFLVEDVKQKVGSIDGIETVNVNIVFDPEWNKDMMSEEAKLELGFL